MSIRLYDIIKEQAEKMPVGCYIDHQQENVRYLIRKETEHVFSYWENGCCLDVDLTIDEALNDFIGN